MSPGLCPGLGAAARLEGGWCLARCLSARARAPPWGIERGSCRLFAALLGSGGSARLGGGLQTRAEREFLL